MLFERIKRGLARRSRPRRAAPGVTPTNPDNSGVTMTLEPEHQNDSDRDDAQTAKPPLVAHEIGDEDTGPLTAFYELDGNALDGEIFYAKKTIDVRRFR